MRIALSALVLSLTSLSLLCALFVLEGCSGSDSAAGRLKDLVAPPAESEAALLFEAKRAYDGGLYRMAGEYFSQLRDGYPSSPYATFAELKFADSLYYSYDYTGAVSAYEEFIRVHPGHEAVSWAQYQIGNAYRNQYVDETRDQAPLQRAIEAYQKLLKVDHGEYSALARKRIDRCREKLAQHDAFVAAFYAKQGQEGASSSRILALEQNYPESRAARDAKRSPGIITAATTEVETPNPSRAPSTPHIVTTKDTGTKAELQTLASSQEPVEPLPEEAPVSPTERLQAYRSSVSCRSYAAGQMISVEFPTGAEIAVQNNTSSQIEITAEILETGSEFEISKPYENSETLSCMGKAVVVKQIVETVTSKNLKISVSVSADAGLTGKPILLRRPPRVLIP